MTIRMITLIMIMIMMMSDDNQDDHVDDHVDDDNDDDDDDDDACPISHFYCYSCLFWGFFFQILLCAFSSAPASLFSKFCQNSHVCSAKKR